LAAPAADLRAQSKLVVLVVAVLALAVPEACRAGAPRPDPVLAAAGDISCPPNSKAIPASCDQGATASLIRRMVPDAVAALGDDQYASGMLIEFTGTGSFDATWGSFKELIHPVPGNHEYDSDPRASGYFQYFKGAAGPSMRGYYSYDLGSWHLIALNSNCSDAACGNYQSGKVSQAEVRWLQGDLAAHPNQCTLAYWHHPRFSSGDHGDEMGVAPLWDTLYRAHTDIVLNGHDHDYERFAKQNPQGQVDANGIREFVVGTGGRDHYTFSKAIDPNSEVRDQVHYGVLFLTLHPESYGWQFRDASGQVLDSGSELCDLAEAAAGSSTSTWLIPGIAIGALLILAIGGVLLRRRAYGYP
jgi:acid phosphatase type 7